MAFNWKSLIQPSQWPWLTAIRRYHWHALPHKTLRKLIGSILALLFIGLSGLFLGYSAVQLTTFIWGSEAKVDSVYAISSTLAGKFHLLYEKAGLYDVAVYQNGQEYPSVYSVYPAWPESIEPRSGDIIRVWPSGHPWVGAPEPSSWGWIILIAFIVIGLVMIEFVFLALAIH